MLFYTMNKLFGLVVVITVLGLGCARPSQNSGKSQNNSNAPKFMVINLHDNVTLTCSLQSVTFLKDGKTLAVQQSASTIGKFVISGNSLTLINFVVKDNGLYSCQGIDGTGQSKTVEWVLHLKPSTNGGKSTMQYKEKPVTDSVMFDCRSPRTDQRLFYSHNKGKDSVEMLPHGRLVTIPKTGLYELLDLKIDDTGFYYCGKSDLLMNLVVRDLPIVTGKSLVKAGDDVSFMCKYKGPQPIAWYKDNEIINVTNKGNANSNHGYQHLILSLKNVTSDAKGEYRCGAEFDGNNTVFTSIKLDIFEFEEDTRFFVIYDPLYNVNLVENATVYFKCRSNQRGNTKYSLLKRPSLPVTASYKEVQTTLNGGIFIIPSLSKADEGHYKCRASFNGLTIEKELGDIWLFNTPNDSS